jgi:hypothetical protein
VFLPLIGSVAYIFTEIIKKEQIGNLENNVKVSFFPSNRIEQLTKRLKFANTFENRIALADAYLHNGMTTEAIQLYEASLTGIFIDNEHVVRQLIDAYYQVGRYEDVIKIVPRISKKIDFNKSKSNILYALSLEKTNQLDLAEREFTNMNHGFSNYEARYSFACFYIRNNKPQEAKQILLKVENEVEHMNRREMGNSKEWINNCLKELRKMN